MCAGSVIGIWKKPDLDMTANTHTHAGGHYMSNVPGFISVVYSDCIMQHKGGTGASGRLDKADVEMKRGQNRRAGHVLCA